MYPQVRQLTLVSTLISALAVVNSAWAITPDGEETGGGGEPAPAVSHPAATPATSPAGSSGHLQIIDDSSSVDDIKKGLGIGQPKPRDLDGLRKLKIGAFIRFSVDSAQVIPSNGLRKMLEALLDLEPGASIDIRGHTDSTGSDSYNMDLSWRRVAAVRNWFEANGVRRDALTTSAAGEREPIDTNATEEGRRRNRRVEFQRIN